MFAGRCCWYVCFAHTGATLPEGTHREWGQKVGSETSERETQLKADLSSTLEDGIAVALLPCDLKPPSPRTLD